MAIEDEHQRVTATLAVIFHEQGDTECQQLLDGARSAIQFTHHDNWDGGTDFYELSLWISARRFAQIENRLKPLEEKIASKLTRLKVGSANDVLNSVQILLDPIVGPGAATLPLPTVTDETRIWAPGRLRLFISHVSRIKTKTAELKQALLPLGVDAFVAHEDIEPTQEWHREIEFALRSMNAMCALVTEDFNKSLWTDQEVGFALGRGVPVVTVRVGGTPYGLMGKAQAMRGDLANTSTLAQGLFDVIVKQESCRRIIIEGLISSLESAITYANAKQSIRQIHVLRELLTPEQIKRILQAARDNSQVREATNVPEQIAAIAKRAGVSLPEPIDDDIPF